MGMRSRLLKWSGAENGKTACAVPDCTLRRVVKYLPQSTQVLSAKYGVGLRLALRGSGQGRGRPACRRGHCRVRLGGVRNNLCGCCSPDASRRRRERRVGTKNGGHRTEGCPGLAPGTTLRPVFPSASVRMLKSCRASRVNRTARAATSCPPSGAPACRRL